MDAMDDDLDAHFSHSSNLYWSSRFNQEPDHQEMVNHRLRTDLRMIATWDHTVNETIDERFISQGPFILKLDESIRAITKEKDTVVPRHVLLKFGQSLCPLIAHNKSLRQQLQRVDDWICEVVAQDDSASDKENASMVAKKTPLVEMIAKKHSVIPPEQKTRSRKVPMTPVDNASTAVPEDSAVRKSKRISKPPAYMNLSVTPSVKKRGIATPIPPEQKKRSKKGPMTPVASTSSAVDAADAAVVVNNIPVGPIASPGDQESPVKASLPSLGQRAIYAYAERMPPTKTGKDKECFVCKGAKEGKLLQCEGDEKRGHEVCATRFHEECIMAYNAGEYSYDFMKEHFGSVCPLHHCSVCMIERRKTSALHGDLISCEKCFRAFHKVCVPASVAIKKQTVIYPAKKGNDVMVKYEIDTIVCHAHVVITGKEKPIKAHLPFCCECETDKGPDKLISCAKCIRSYHGRCHQFTTIIDGDEEEDAKKICEGCIYQDHPRAEQNAIARYSNSFYPCKAVALDRYPAHCAKSDTYGKFYSHPGYVAVEWAGCQNLFSLLPVSLVVPMFSGSYYFLGKRMRDCDIMLAWKHMDDHCDPPYMPLPPNDNYIHIEKSELVGSCKQIGKLKEIEAEQVICICDGKKGPRCAPGGGCANRHFDMECPPECAEKEGGCGNRVISDSRVHPSIEKRIAEGKGYGIFATGPIKMGVMLAEYAGEIIDLEEKQRRVEQCAKWRNNEETHYMMSLDATRIIDCKKKGNIARFINHSCDPNCKMVVVDVVVSSIQKKKDHIYKVDRRVGVITIRDIKPDEELTFNYQMDQYAPGIDVPNCMCGSENCTGKLAGKKTDRKKEPPKDAKQPSVKKTSSTVKKTSVKTGGGTKRPRSSTIHPSRTSDSTGSSSGSVSVAQSVKRRRRSTTTHPASPQKLRRSPRNSMDGAMPQLVAEEDEGADAGAHAQRKSPEANEAVSPPPPLEPADRVGEEEDDENMKDVSIDGTPEETEKNAS